MDHLNNKSLAHETCRTLPKTILCPIFVGHGGWTWWLDMGPFQCWCPFPCMVFLCCLVLFVVFVSPFSSPTTKKNKKKLLTY